MTDTVLGNATIPYIALYDGYFTYEADKDGEPTDAATWYTAKEAPDWID